MPFLGIFLNEAGDGLFLLMDQISARVSDKAETQKKMEMRDQEIVLMALKFLVSTSPRDQLLTVLVMFW